MAAKANAELLAELDALLLELEYRLANYIEAGPSVQEAADEGLLLAMRTNARLNQTDKWTGRARMRLESVGVGNWNPRGAFADDARLEGVIDDD